MICSVSIDTLRSYVSCPNVSPVLEGFIINPLFTGWLPVCFGIPSSSNLAFFKSIYSKVRLRLCYDVDSSMLRADNIFRDLWENED